MTGILARVDAVAQQCAAYSGIAIHHYGSWRALRP
ncbi:hypothetical protein J2S43_003407 [Catenuloplanes nepalensis]|uniref:Lysozyme n=1 Tax=Catenuloplanes nepalensis TaxID=587533 RepID=A0ABT9MU15_9ACTN|nr:hypothetical protein [Catenuloplanes nepalensis]